ncbi:MAG: glycoside hydrolase family 9 protein [Bacteroidota bacterium]
MILFFHAELLLSQTGIIIDQLGYRPNDPKIAFIRQAYNGNFQVINILTKKVSFEHHISAIGSPDDGTGDDVFNLDFSDLTAPGSYYIAIPGLQVQSAVFRISNEVYNEAVTRGLESFYYQRCGTEVKNGTVWQHPACHLDDAYFYVDPSNKIDLTGGWHDAGDYGKFTATGTISAAFLLYLYEDRSDEFLDHQLNIPETANKIPDILDEVRWELSWLLKMQNNEGAVYHKVSTKQWTGEYLPQDDPDKRYVYAVSSTATGSFAAVTALGARIFGKWDKPFSQILLRASINAWQYLQNHRTIVPEGGFHNPPDVSGGEYGDIEDTDERLWAAVELYRTTDNQEYHHYFVQMYKELGTLNPVSWEMVQNFAVNSYLKIPAEQTDFTARSLLVARLTGYCDLLLKKIELGGYRCVLKSGEFYWGSNSVDAAYTFDLLGAYQTTKSVTYLNGAIDQLHYLLGRNTFSLSFETGVGANPVQHPYHQFSMMLNAGSPVPGLLVGGPNKNSQLNGIVISEFPGKCYEDNEKNYYVNEVAINYTAPFVYLAGYLANLAGNSATDSGMNDK